MNWLGKVFVVVIVILSLMFMGLAMGVYATHKNWQQVNEKLKSDLQKAQGENQRLVAEHNQKAEELEREKTAERHQAVKLETERVAIVQRNWQIRSELDSLTQNQRDHIAAVARTQAINQGLATEVNGLRKQIRTAEGDRDKLFQKVLDATEQLHESAAEYNAARERNEQLTQQVAGK